ncbi:hypothetical protein SAMN06297387_10998 [Streptomyces zhaozhouensis]|uniref:Uncharacterized protein n=1 Tax=Streptomyces zhaozhouensis TaxID=1300267 RepID=A0A286DWZ5_9ACTN|nr:hypothetical protein [Streptomyces zhaozhouensis]SOD63156.1 hypothetical protein SAMN06297387_10998 [Streptomyces zhaozhouensis]
MQTDVPFPTWLPTAEQGPRPLPCGRWFDAVGAGGAEAARAIARLGERTGPVIHHPAEHTMFWLVQVGAADLWRLPGVTVLGAGERLTVPPPSRTEGPCVRWLIPPHRRCLTDAAALHHVLKVVTASGHRTPDAYRTVECHTGAHRLCTKAVAPPPPAGIPVIYLACDCGCHERALGPGRGSLAS